MGRRESASSLITHADASISSAWGGPNGDLEPGDYSIPGEIALVHAKCARADGAGEIIARGNFPEPPANAGKGAGKRKAGAAENKRRVDAPENKSEV